MWGLIISYQYPDPVMKINHRPFRISRNGSQPSLVDPREICLEIHSKPLFFGGSQLILRGGRCDGISLCGFFPFPEKKPTFLKSPKLPACQNLFLSSWLGFRTISLAKCTETKPVTFKITTPRSDRVSNNERIWEIGEWGITNLNFMHYFWEIPPNYLCNICIKFHPPKTNNAPTKTEQKIPPNLFQSPPKNLGFATVQDADGKSSKHLIPNDGFNDGDFHPMGSQSLKEITEKKNKSQVKIAGILMVAYYNPHIFWIYPQPRMPMVTWKIPY